MPALDTSLSRPEHNSVPHEERPIDATLPIDVLRDRVLEELADNHVVISSPTGSGKSTRVPRWCQTLGRVLVIEPRRVACRSLATWVAKQESCELGTKVGYVVRDDRRARQDTRILFATPGVVLRMTADQALDSFSVIVIDEFHERTLDVDLLLAMLLAQKAHRLVVMSATLDADRVANYLGGTHLRAEGRTFPVERHHIAGQAHLPCLPGVEDRLLQAVRQARNHPGDILVFLPGKAEIASAMGALRGESDLEVLPLHGGLSLEEQARVFTPARKRRVIVSTNVAETSLTLPGVGVVIDSGLVRQTRYFSGRGFLSLVPIAEDSAEQRTGRAGRTAPGVCYRLWSSLVRLKPHTPPEIHRESLVPLVLATAACGTTVEALPFIDRPKPFAVEAASEQLLALGALQQDSAITERGRSLFGLPVDPALGRLLVEAQSTGCLGEMIDLVAILNVDRPLFRAGQRPDEEDDLRRGGCDALAAILALRKGNAQTHALVPFTLKEARRISQRLRRAFDLPRKAKESATIDRQLLIQTVIAADRRTVHLARHKRGRVNWSNGGTEIEVAKDSAINQEKQEFIAVLGSRAITLKGRDTRVIATCAMALHKRDVLGAGLGRDRLARSLVSDEGCVVSEIERVYAGRVLDTREEIPTGTLAREAFLELLTSGRLFPDTLAITRDRLEASQLYNELARRNMIESVDTSATCSLEEWLMARMESVGIERGDELELLNAEDFLAPQLPDSCQQQLEREFPRTLTVGDAQYRVEYDLNAREVTLVKISGLRKDPPSLTWLPRFRRLCIKYRDRGKVRVLRP